jgi:hypothetical protein
MTTVATWSGFPGGDEPSRYVNSASIATSQWDVAIDFQHSSQVPGSFPQPQVEQRPVTRVVMSPMHAKAMAHFLDQAVSKWEETYGPLPTVDRLMGAPPSPAGDLPGNQSPNVRPPEGAR